MQIKVLLSILLMFAMFSWNVTSRLIASFKERKNDNKNRNQNLKLDPTWGNKRTIMSDTIWCTYKDAAVTFKTQKQKFEKKRWILHRT